MWIFPLFFRSERKGKTMYADKVLISNLIYTGREDCVMSGGVAVKGNRIVAVCSDGETEKYIGPETEVYRFEDKLIMPGLIDNHLHMTMGALFHDNDIELEGTKSKEECVEKVREFLIKKPDASLVLTQGWMNTSWDDRSYPDRKDLDAVSTDIPICLGTADGWWFWVNTKALEMFGYTKGNIPEELKGSIPLDEEGNPTGMLYWQAAAPAYFMMMDIDPEIAMELLENSLEIYSRCGITAAGDLSNEHRIEKEPAGFRLYREMEKRNRLDVRVYIYPSIGKTTDFAEAHKLKEEYSDGYVIMPGLKAYEDGVIDSYTAVVVEPYEDNPKNPEKNGTPIFTQEKLNEIVTAANREGFPVRIHCTGDGGTRMSLNAFEASLKANGNHGLRNGIEHIEMIHEDDIHRFRELEVAANKQPAHLLLCSEEFMTEAIGEKRWKYSHPFRAFIDAGAHMSLSTDFPIVSVNPFHTIYASMTRKLATGELVGSNPDDVLTIYEALYGYTYMGAYCMGVEDEIGSLEEGKLADIAVIDGRVIDESPERISERKSCLTMMDGRIVYKA